MNNLSTAERRTLELMKKDNFRGISKEELIKHFTDNDPIIDESVIAQYYTEASDFIFFVMNNECIAYDKYKKYMFAGFGDGTIRVFEVDKISE